MSATDLICHIEKMRGSITEAQQILRENYVCLDRYDGVDLPEKIKYTIWVFTQTVGNTQKFCYDGDWEQWFQLCHDHVEPVWEHIKRMHVVYGGTSRELDRLCVLLGAQPEGWNGITLGAFRQTLPEALESVWTQIEKDLA